MIQMMQYMVNGSWGFAMFNSWLMYILMVTTFVLLIIWLVKQINK